MEREEPLSPTSHLLHAPGFNCFIVAIMGFKTKLNINLFKAGLENSILKHPRFSSLVVVDDRKGGMMKWIKTPVDLENHVKVPDLDPNVDSQDQFVEDYITDLTTAPMDHSKPLWEVHLLNVKISDADAVAVFRIHHSLGDGASLISLLLACSRKTSDPEAFPDLPTRKQVRSSNPGGLCGFVVRIWLVILMICNTIVDVLLIVATIMFLKDSDTSIKGAPRVEPTPQRVAYRSISLNDIKLVKNVMNMV